MWFLLFFLEYNSTVDHRILCQINTTMGINRHSFSCEASVSATTPLACEILDSGKNQYVINYNIEITVLLFHTMLNIALPIYGRNTCTFHTYIECFISSRFFSFCK